MTNSVAFCRKKPNWSQKFPVNGQGIVIFNIKQDKAFSIVVRTEDSTYRGGDWVSLDVHREYAKFYYKLGSTKKTMLTEGKNSEKKNVGYEEDKKISYWLSYDRDNLVLKYGKGYRMEETILMKHDFLKGIDCYFRQMISKYLECSIS